MKVKALSATSVKMYDACPFQWKLKYKDNCLQMANPAFIIGTAFHKGVELLHANGDILSIIDGLKKEMLNGETTTPEQIDRFGLVRMMLESYSKYPINIPTIETEYKFTVPIFGLTTPITGFIDRIVEGGIVEYKTSAFDYTIDDIANVQTDIYSFAYRQRFSTMPLVTYVIMNKNKVKRADYQPQVLRVTRDDSHMEALIRKMVAIEYAIGQDRFDPKPGTHCRWCPYNGMGCNYAKYGN